MTEAEQDQGIGKMVRKRHALVTRQVCLRNKAEGLARGLQYFASVLSAASKREGWEHPGYDGYPAVEDVRGVLEGIAETDVALSTLDERQDQLGITPPKLVAPPRQST